MTRTALPMLICMLALTAACTAPQKSAVRAPGTPGVPPEAEAAARKLLGADSKVLAFGDLAHDGHKQALVINPLEQSTTRPGQGIQFRRAGVLEQRGARWAEVLRCDEYLKNPHGYLAGTPILPVTGWRLRFEPGGENKKPEFYFTPLGGQENAHPRSIGVRWNARVARYESMDATGKHFLAELPSLEIPASELR
jgi:hypothetical protein